MNEPVAKILITNDRETPRIVWVEPWGEDYTLRGGEVIEVIARGKESPPWFNVVETGNATLVYIEGESDDFIVQQNGVRIECGHNRGL